jgi:hypothetical protein
LRVESARIALKPPIPISVTAASAPPARITSACPRRITSAASPIAWLPAAQAVVVQLRGPPRPSSIDTCAAAMFAIIIGTSSGERRPGPRSTSTRACSVKVCRPPTPLAITAPMRASWPLTLRPASASASFAAATPSWAKRSIRRADLRSMYSVGSKSRTSQANLVSYSDTSKSVIGRAPERPSSTDRHTSSGPTPMEVSSPRPVTTTRRRSGRSAPDPLTSPARRRPAAGRR